MTFVHLSCCNDLTDDALLFICTLPKVTGISLFGCSGITDNGIKHLSEHIIQLQDLSLACLYKITDVGLTYLPKFSQLNKLNLSLCRNLTENGYLSLTQLTSLTNLTLSEIDDSPAPDITDAVLVGFSNSLLQLKELDLSYCTKITDKGLAPICKNLQNLRTFRINGCKNVTPDCGLLLLPKLWTFDAKGCPQLEDVKAQIAERSPF